MEIELKYLIEEPIARDKILKDNHLEEIKEPGSDEVIKLNATYMDTDALDLSKGKMAFRVRYENDNPVATLKWDGEIDGCLHIRGELNVPVDEEFVKNPTLTVFKGSEIYEELQQIAGDKPLKPIVQVNCIRKQIMVDTGLSICAIALDEGEVVTEKGSCPISELEIELYSGDQDDMLLLGKKLAEKYNLKEGTKSKFQVGMELFTGEKHS
jgi:inorganic triphosphatase YgiF